MMLLMIAKLHATSHQYSNAGSTTRQVVRAIQVAFLHGTER